MLGELYWSVTESGQGRESAHYWNGVWSTTASIVIFSNLDAAVGFQERIGDELSEFNFCVKCGIEPLRSRGRV